MSKITDFIKRTFGIDNSDERIPMYDRIRKKHDAYMKSVDDYYSGEIKTTHDTFNMEISETRDKSKITINCTSNMKNNITEGTCSKGGVNPNPPTSPRPCQPLGQGNVNDFDYAIGKWVDATNDHIKWERVQYVVKWEGFYFCSCNCDSELPKLIPYKRIRTTNLTETSDCKNL